MIGTAAVALLGLLALTGYLASVLWPRVVVVEQRSVAKPSGAVGGRPGLQDFDDLVAAACPAVVSIVPVEEAQPGRDDTVARKTASASPGGGAAEAVAPSSAPADPASGFLIAADGTVVAASASLGEATAFTVRLTDGRALAAKRTADDLATGLALLHVSGDDLPFVRFATTSFPRAAQWLVAVESPAARGCIAQVSAVEADSLALAKPNANYLALRPDLDAVATGAPLFNAEGRVVGIAGLGLGRDADLAKGSARYALPAGLAQRRIDAMARGTAAIGALGAIADDLTPALAVRLGAAEDRRGVYVALVMSGSPAERAGLRVGDIVISRDGQPISRARDFDQSRFANNTAIALAIDRGGTAITLSLAPPPQPDDRAIKTGKTAGLQSARRSR
ncbi:S1C family serine protease [Sphingomonas glacialis]|nr:trypsin-like peptidase domain-containing protein [Sphingomonas glacialis]